jgi:Sin3 histone deacetylase corepressor complex component SDS3
MSDDDFDYLSNDGGAEYEDGVSDEDTEDASETDMNIKYEGEYTEIKEQMYQDKLANLKDQLKQLDSHIHPEYVRRVKKVEHAYHERIILNEAFLCFETDRIDKEYITEKHAVGIEFDDRKIELKENLLAELDEKKRMIEMERTSVELTSDAVEPKPITTRKLRRRPNDPLPQQADSKRKRGSPAQLNQLLEESEILDDIKAISKAYNAKYDIEMSSNLTEARIEDGKLYYDRKWYHRGQQIAVKPKMGEEFSANLHSITNSEIWVRKVSDGSKVKVLLTQLQKGKYSLHRLRA